MKVDCANEAKWLGMDHHFGDCFVVLGRSKASWSSQEPGAVNEGVQKRN
jgi:hypothetical protein